MIKDEYGQNPHLQELEKKYYLPDIESGVKYEVTKEYYEAYMIMWEIVVPKINHIMGVPIIVGTAGELNNDIKDFFYARK